MSSAKVLAMNAKAVSFLLQGNHEFSQCTLENALEGFRDILNEAHDEGDSDSDDVDMESTTLHTVIIQEALHHNVAGEASSSCCCDSHSDTVYNRAFVLTSDEQEPYFAQNEHTVPAILLYNMGLSRHLEANQTGKSATLRKALHLYTMSFTMLEQASDFLNDMDITVLLALANNMGVISGSQLYDRPAAETSRLMMERTLSAPECLDALEEEDAQFFSLNLMFLTEFQRRAWAPAA